MTVSYRVPIQGSHSAIRKMIKAHGTRSEKRLKRWVIGSAFQTGPRAER